MATTTIRVSMETRDLLHRLARTKGTSMQEILDNALEHYRRKQFLEALNAAYAARHSDPQTQAEESEELALWDTTLLDGLDEQEDWNES